MKKILWIIVAMLVVGYFVNVYVESKAKREKELVEAKKAEENLKSLNSAVAEMVSRSDAVDDWKKRLSKGESFRLGPIFTVELEKLWLGNRPILFIGAIKDVTTYDESYYTVLIEKSFLVGSLDYIFATKLQLSLRSPKKRIDTFFKQHPNLIKDGGFDNGVAVIARIKTIQATYTLGEDGDRKEIKTGEGELIDILYIGGFRF